MRAKLKWIIPLVLVAIAFSVYFSPVPRLPFEEIYARVSPVKTASLESFRQNHPLQTAEVDGEDWEYVAFGDGEETILFLHGMTGAYDIWWQQMEALQDDYRVISLTYPPVDSLEEMSRGVMAILEQEGVQKVNVVGSSLGGYLAQYLVAEYPEIINKAVFANTFPPNDLIAEKNRTIGAALPYLPEWLVIKVLRGSFRDSVYPASGRDELTLAYMLEQSYGRMSKAQVVSRFHAVIDPFIPADLEALGIPVLIIESDNDPLVEETLREMLKDTYPSAEVVTLHNVGHFPYLNQPEEYTRILRSFFEGN
jgi:pimeloyl-ACP methyl ester carboxylesterase